jgi:hypothetical protein
VFYGTRRFITAFTRARHLSLTWARSIQSVSPPPPQVPLLNLGWTETSVRFQAYCVRFVTWLSFYGEELTPRPTLKLEDHPLSAVRDCLFNILAATLMFGHRLLNPQPEEAPYHGDRKYNVRLHNKNVEYKYQWFVSFQSLTTGLRSFPKIQLDSHPLYMTESPGELSTPLRTSESIIDLVSFFFFGGGGFSLSLSYLTHLHLVPRLRKSEPNLHSLYMPSQRVQGQLYLHLSYIITGHRFLHSYPSVFTLRFSFQLYITQRKYLIKHR